MKIFFNVLIPLLITCQYLHSQSPDPLSFFPHHQGDVWEYVRYGSNDTVQNIIIKDSLAPDGKYYIETTWFGEFRLDTITYEVYGKFLLDYNALIYKLDADSGDIWVVQNIYGKLVAQVDDVFPLFIFNKLVSVKKINYYLDSTSGLLWFTRYLASNLGLIGDVYDLSPDLRLRGALINGVLYGSIRTSVEEENKNSNKKYYQLYTNYPNPFNSITSISFEISEKTNVELSIYDILGRKIKTIVKAVYSQNRYNIVWDGTDENGKQVSSGIYIYKLKTDHYVTQKKMILLR